MDTVATAPEIRPDPPPLLIAPGVNLRLALGCCPHAQTLTAYDAATLDSLVMALPCKQWSCRLCAETKIRRLAAKTRDAKPNRLLTLTVDPKLHADPRAAFDATRRCVPQLIQSLRTRFKDIEYLRVTEVTRNGWPHYHLLIRSNFLPHKVVRDQWAALTGATIIDLRQVQQSFAAYKYLVKYLSKLHKIEWTERHVSYSRGFFPPDPPYQKRFSIQGPKLHKSHPATYLEENEQGSSIVNVAQNIWRLLPLNQHSADF